MRGHVALFYGVLYRDLIMLRRYPVDTLSYFFMFFFYFSIIFYGGKMVPGNAVGSSLNAIIVGFFLWTLTLTTFIFLANRIHQEAQWGTLEQLYLSPYRFTTVMFAAVSSSALTSSGIALTNLALILVLTGERLTIDLVTVIPIISLTLFSSIGIGFVFAGLALVYKRVRSLLQMVQFLFIGLISAPVFDIVWVRLLPVTQGSAMLNRAMVEGIRIWEFSLLSILLLLLTAVGYLGIGYVVFFISQHRARQHGILDEY